MIVQRLYIIITSLYLSMLSIRDAKDAYYSGKSVWVPDAFFFFFFFVLAIYAAIDWCLPLI